VDIAKELNNFIVSTLDAPRAIGFDDDLIDLGLIDSFGILELLDFINQEFGVNLSPDDVVPENFRSIHSLTTLIEAKIL
jgi:acyl carrier protein